MSDPHEATVALHERRDDTTGLTAAQVAARVANGEVNAVPTSPSRTVGEIVRANVVTRFNLLVGALLAVVLVVAPPQDALFGIVLVANSAVGIIQELRAKRTLDRLALVSAPRARVVREGVVQEVPLDEIVLGDVLQVGPGDQIVVDGVVVAAAGLEVDESLLTGEADPVHKRPRSTVLSGSFVAAGQGRYRATAVGRDAYATRLAEEARQFTLVRSELREGIDWILRVIGWLLVPAIPLLVWTQLRAASGLRSALASAVAGSVAMIPQGLVLLTSVAFAVSVVRLGNRKVLVQELPAVEGLARVDTICLDKTGTLTHGNLVVHEVVALERDEHVPAALGALAVADPNPNATLQAIAKAHPPPVGWLVNRSVPFSSARKWSAAAFAGHGTWVLGAPDVLLPADAPELAETERHAAEGRRVVLLARSDGPLVDDVLPPGLQPQALVVLGDEIKADAADTLRYFAEQGVVAKVISGDHPRTVGAIATQVGLPGGDRPVDGPTLPDDPERLAEVMETHHVFGRVSPQQKRAMVKALQSRGHVVAMTGDGVNDVLALKDADMGLAMASGSGAARAVAQIVLLDSAFSAVPDIVAEGRRVTNNIERVANLFVTKTVYALLLTLAVATFGAVFPFLPRHLTLVSSLTIGAPAFFLALEPSERRYQPGFIGRVLRFALPTGTVAAVATFATYRLAQMEGATLDASRTTATLVLGAVGLFALVLVCRAWTRLQQTVVATMAVLFVLLFLFPGGREFFALEMPRTVLVLAAIGVVAITGVVVFGSLRAFGWLRHVRFEDVTGFTSAAARGSRQALREGWRAWREARRERRADRPGDPDGPPAQPTGDGVVGPPPVGDVRGDA